MTEFAEPIIDGDLGQWVRTRPIGDPLPTDTAVVPFSNAPRSGGYAIPTAANIPKPVNTVAQQTGPAPGRTGGRMGGSRFGEVIAQNQQINPRTNTALAGAGAASGAVVGGVVAGIAVAQDTGKISHGVGAGIGAAAGGYIGASLGAAIGSAGGPVGAVVGAAIGGAIGGSVGAIAGQQVANWLDPLPPTNLNGGQTITTEDLSNTKGEQGKSYDFNAFGGVFVNFYAAGVYTGRLPIRKITYVQHPVYKGSTPWYNLTDCRNFTNNLYGNTAGTYSLGFGPGNACFQGQTEFVPTAYPVPVIVNPREAPDYKPIIVAPPVVIPVPFPVPTPVVVPVPVTYPIPAPETKPAPDPVGPPPPPPPPPPPYCWPLPGDRKKPRGDEHEDPYKEEEKEPREEEPQEEEEEKCRIEYGPVTLERAFCDNSVQPPTDGLTTFEASTLEQTFQMLAAELAALRLAVGVCEIPPKNNVQANVIGSATAGHGASVFYYPIGADVRQVELIITGEISTEIRLYNADQGDGPQAKFGSICIAYSGVTGGYAPTSFHNWAWTRRTVLEVGPPVRENRFVRVQLKPSLSFVLYDTGIRN